MSKYALSYICSTWAWNGKNKDDIGASAIPYRQDIAKLLIHKEAKLDEVTSHKEDHDCNIGIFAIQSLGRCPLYSISEIVALEVNEIAQNLKDILVSNGFADADIDPNYIDDVEKAVGKKKNPSRTKTLAVMRKAAQFDSSSLFSQLCFQGCSFVVVSSSSIFLSFGSIQMSTMNFHCRRVPIYLFLLNCILHQKRLFHWSQFTQLPIQLSPNRGWCLFGSLSFILSLFILLFSSLVDA